RATEEGLLLTVLAPQTAARLRPMGSVAVAGVCLTVVACDGERFSVLVGAESAARTTLRPPLDGRAVNLELPLCAGDRLDGHLVQGHVDGRLRSSRAGAKAASSTSGSGRASG